MTDSASPSSANADVKAARCPRCARRFDCGRGAAPFDCWCKALPALPANRVDPHGRCLCPECLAASVAEATAPRPHTPG